MTANGAIAPLRTSRMKLGEIYVIALRSPIGEPTTSKYDGDQLKFHMVDGNTLYTEPYVGERLKAAAVRPGIDFEMLKVETVVGNQRSAEVIVRPVGVRAPTAAVVVVPPGGAERVYSQPHPTPSFIAAPPAPPSVIAPAPAPHESELERALKNAIEACSNAERYAKSIDYDCRFSPEQVKCMAISVLIGMQQARR